jgi:hypothetical protein
MVDLIEGGLFLDQGSPRPDTCCGKGTVGVGKIQDDHVDGGARNGLFSLEHVNTG